MNTLAVFVFCVAAANAHFIQRDALLAGPSARSVLAGPDGSHIISEVEGGAVLPQEIIAAPVPEVVVARAEPIFLPAVPEYIPEYVPQYVVPRAEPIFLPAVAAPEIIVPRAEPIFLPRVTVPEVLPLPLAPVVHSVPYLEQGRSDIIAGPSGTIVANRDFGIAPIVPSYEEVYVEPAVRTILPTHGLTYGRSLFGERVHGLGGLYGQGYGHSPLLF